MVAIKKSFKKNAENILLIDDPSLALIYKNNWESRVTEARKMPL